MATDLKSLCKEIERSNVHLQGKELEVTIPGCSYSLRITCAGIRSPWDCNEFVPIDWKEHIYANGEWWS